MGNWHRVRRQRGRSLLPYTLTLDLEVTGTERHRLLEGWASGDMEEFCRWTFEAAGRGSVVRFLMAVEPTRAWMNLPLPFARRVFGLITARSCAGAGRDWLVSSTPR